MTGFWYLAGPYSKLDHEQANKAHCEAAALLTEMGITVFSPIGHGHSIATTGGLGFRDAEWWLDECYPFAKAAKGCIILTLDGWKESYGTTQETNWFLMMDKPIVFMTPGEVPNMGGFEE